MTGVRKAVIPAAGLGTRFLPASKAIPKEMIPVVDRPGIQYVVEEAVAAGLDDILIVTSRGKSSIEDHFDRAPALESHLEATGKASELAEIVAIAELAEIHFVRQKTPAGFGDAVSAARGHVGSEPFVVMVADEIVPEPAPGEPRLLSELIRIYEERATSVVAVQEVAGQEVSSYGIIDPEGLDDGVALIKDMIEKPAPDDAPSNLASRGRYLFTPAIFDALEETPPGYGGEIQLTDAIRRLAATETVHAYVHEGPVLDVGRKIDYLRATLHLALERDDLAGPLVEILRAYAPLDRFR